MTGSPGRPHRGRRDNGLDATEFVPLEDVDPRIGEHLLDVLGIVGIAAYLVPSADLNPIVRATTLPARPTDRLWVDRERLDEARGLLEAVREDDAAGAPPAGREGASARPAASVQPLDVDVDIEWERIVAGYDATAAPDRSRRHALAEPIEGGSAVAEPERDAPPPSATARSDSDLADADLTGTDLTEAAGLAAVEPVDATAPPAVIPADPTADPLPVRTPGAGEQPARHPPEAPQTGADAPPTDDGPTATEAAPARATPAPPVVPEPDRPLGRDRLTGTDAPPSDFDTNEGDTDENEGYNPPPPPPLPRLSAPVLGALAAIAVGLVLLFRSDTLGLSEQVRLLLALGGILGGAGALVWRLRDGWSDDDPDDGAVV